MTEPRKNRPTGWSARAVVKGNEMSENTFAATIVVPADAVDKVRGSLSLNSVAQASVDFYVAALEEAGVDPEALSFAEVVEVTRRLYAPSADYRRAQADVAKAEKEAEKAEAKAKRDAERAERDIAKIAEIEARLEKLRANG
jgi:hypothetical protein